MKANELMPNDLVEYGGKVVQVLQLDRGVEYPHINPLPLTPEFMRKNEFKEILRHFCISAKKGVFVSLDKEGEKNGSIDGITVKSFSFGTVYVQVNMSQQEIGKVLYVHEFQHLLRVLGSDKADTLKY